PDLGPEVVFMSGALDWAVDGVGRHERVVFNRGTRGEWRLPGGTLQPWLDANIDLVCALEDQVERLITAPYGHQDGPIAHALACATVNSTRSPGRSWSASGVPGTTPKTASRNCGTRSSASPDTSSDSARTGWWSPRGSSPRHSPGTSAARSTSRAGDWRRGTA